MDQWTEIRSWRISETRISRFFISHAAWRSFTAYTSPLAYGSNHKQYAARSYLFSCISLGNILLLLFQIYYRLLVTRWWSSGKSRSQQEITAIYPSTLKMMCTVLIRATFGSSVVDGWPESNWKFWLYPLIVPNAPITISTIFVLTFHILLTSISRPLHLLSFSASFVLTSNHLVWLYRSVSKFIIIIVVVVGQDIPNARQR